MDALKLRAVVQGEEIVLPVAGGFRRQPAPCDGYYLDTDWPAFIPGPTFDMVRSELGRARKRRDNEVAEAETQRRRERRR